MTINKLMKVLDYALEQATASHIPIVVNDVSCAYDYDLQCSQLKAMIREVEAEKKRIDDKDYDACYAIHESNMIDLLNETTYKDYARVYRKREGAGFDPHPTFWEYKREVDKRHSFVLDNKVLQAAYEFIHDLFDDNEVSHTPCDD